MRSMTICVSGKYASVIYDSDAKYMLVLPMCGDDDKFDFEQFTLELRRRTQKPLAFVFYAIEEPERELIPLFSEPLPGGEPFEHANETLDIIENAMIPEVIRRLHLSRDIKTVLGGCSLAGLFSLWAAHMTDSFFAVASVSPALAVPGWKDFADKYNMLFFETSAKTGDNIDKVFFDTASKIIQSLENGFYDLEDENCGIKISVTSKKLKIINNKNDNNDGDEGVMVEKNKCC